ncbi:MAG: pyridoxamine 5'-phosphate oxidase family protein [Clostridia bacterium]|nr:pyridoxamine 5'-phosphate oxidase family protein [Clostridia bacterium]
MRKRLMALLLMVTLFGGGLHMAHAEESTLAFFQSLDFTDGISVVRLIFERFPLQYATTLGLDGEPQIRPIEYKFEEDGVLYFDTVTFYTSYQELLKHPKIQLCICDQETMTYLRLGGTVNFTSDPDIISRCFDASPVLTSQFGEHRDVVIAYYLTDVWAEFVSFEPSLPRRTYQLTNKYDTDK